jgi:hypothetical protein
VKWGFTTKNEKEKHENEKEIILKACKVERNGATLYNE